jgi:uncharacterized membrane protein YgcG
MWLRTLLAGGLLAGLLSACAIVDPVDQRYDTVSRSLAKARDQAIFLNLVRASHDYPLAFTTIANVTPTMTNTSSFGLPSFLEGPGDVLRSGTAVTSTFPTSSPFRDFVYGNTTASNSTAVGTNFNVSTEETGSFYQGFLKPIDLQTLNYFLRQGYPRELLFWLFADSFQFEIGSSPLHALGYQYNPPDSYGCPRDRLPNVPQLCFRDWIWAALLAGLTVEEKTILKSGGGSGGGGGGSQGSHSSGGGSKGAETTTVSRFCFSPFLQRQAINEIGPTAAAIRPYMPFSLSMIKPDQLCGNWSDKAAEQQTELPQGDTFKLAIGPYTFRIVPRSAYGVFEFLGNLLKVQEGLEPPASAFIIPPRPSLPPVTDLPPVLLTTHDEPLITVLRNSGGNCFSHTWFYDGDYCVPQSATNTKRIFSLLSQLIAIETAATDLSFTPVVRVIQ